MIALLEQYWLGSGRSQCTWCLLSLSGRSASRSYRHNLNLKRIQLQTRYCKTSLPRIEILSFRRLSLMKLTVVSNPLMKFLAAATVLPGPLGGILPYVFHFWVWYQIFLIIILKQFRPFSRTSISEQDFLCHLQCIFCHSSHFHWNTV